MGKTQSKSLGLYRKRDGPEGECFVVNAHFNPLAVAELDETYKPPKTPSEITLSLSSIAKDCEIINRAGFAEDKYPLKVVLPPEGSRTSLTSCVKEAIVKSEVEDSSEVEGKKDLTFHGFECDVSVEADIAGREKQEFLFTLYDLDGYGKITKDDVASLVRSIYEAMGSSLKLPPSGSKTIKVRLTVAPDKKMKEEESGKQESGKACSEKEAKHVAEDEREHDDEDERNDADAEEDDDEEDVDEELGDREKSYPYPILSSHHHRQRPLERSRKNPTLASTHKNTPASHRCSTSQPASNSRQPHRSSCIMDEQHPSLSPSPGRKRNKVSFSSPRLLQKHQLLEIIQANLEKNNFGSCLDSSKKRFEENGEDDERQRRHSKLRQHHCGQRYREGRSHYLDLAGIENYASILDRNLDDDVDGVGRMGDKCDVGGSGDSSCPYQVMDSNHVCSKTARERGYHACHKPRHHHHHRSRSHDLADSAQYFRYHMLPDNNEELHRYPRQNQLRVEEILKGGMEAGEKLDWYCAGGKNHRDRDLHAALYHARSKSYDAYYCEAAPVSFSPRLKVRSSKEGAPACSPHHYKFRFREREHQRAMQQVASWIEKEHLGLGGSPSSGIPKGEGAQHNLQQQRPHYHHHHHHHHQPNDPTQRPPPPHATPPKTPEKTPLLMERHEHHHIHEHYHHHYHHYHEL